MGKASTAIDVFGGFGVIVRTVLLESLSLANSLLVLVCSTMHLGVDCLLKFSWNMRSLRVRKQDFICFLLTL